MITLMHGDYELVLAPQYGGCIVSFKKGERHLLRPPSPRQGDPWDARMFAAFPMIPFVGRIEEGRFTHKGRHVTLPANMPPESHAIHGLGWQSEWDIEHAGQSDATLRHSHDGSVWPWSYEANQRFQLTDTGLTLTLNLTNTSQEAMPAGFGWHPYFPKSGAALTAPVTQAWTGRQTAPETSRLTAETSLKTRRPVDALNLDTAYDVETLPIQMCWPDHTISLKSDTVFSKLTVFTPRSEAWFCVEPITHAPNAINMTLNESRTGLRNLAPRQTLSGTITMDVDVLS